jgi:copper chaperone CopZ
MVDRVILEDIFVFVAGMSALGCVTAVVITTIKRWGTRRRVETSDAISSQLSDISERLSRLDGSVEAVAIEVERISEAQRFTARVLAERSAGTALPVSVKPAGSKTPH